MKWNSSLFAACLLTGGAAFLITTLPQIAMPASKSCRRCSSNGCELTPGEYLVQTAVTNELSCVQKTGVKGAFCSITKRIAYDIYQPDPLFADDNIMGNCYKMRCSTATPTGTKCANPQAVKPVKAVKPKPGPKLGPAPVPASCTLSGNTQGDTQ